MGYKREVPHGLSIGDYLWVGYKGEVLDGLPTGDYLWVIKEKYSMGCPLMVNLPVPLLHIVTSALAVLRLPEERSAAIRRMLHTAQHLDSCAMSI